MAHNKLYRNFIILQEDERGYSHSNDKALSGYAKVEAKGDKCKVSFYAQNLRQEDNYSMVLICCKRDLKQLIDLGPLAINEVGKGDTSKEYYVNNIAGLGISYEKISGAAICRVKDNETTFIMHGFMNGEDSADNWRKFKIIKVDSKKYINRLDTDLKKKDILNSDVADKGVIAQSNNVETKFMKTPKSQDQVIEHKKDENNIKPKVNIEVEVLTENNYKPNKDIISQSNNAEIKPIKRTKSEDTLLDYKKDERDNIELESLRESNFIVEGKQENVTPEDDQKVAQIINDIDEDRNKCKEAKKCDKKDKKYKIEETKKCDKYDEKGMMEKIKKCDKYDKKYIMEETKKCSKCEKNETVGEIIDNLAKELDTYDGVIDLKISDIHDDIIVYGFIKDKKNKDCKWKKFKLEKKCRNENQDFNNIQGNSKRIEENFRLDKLNQIDNKTERRDRLDIIDFDEYENDIQQTGSNSNMQQPISKKIMQQENSNEDMQQMYSKQDFKISGEVGQYFEKLAGDFEPYDGSLTDINYCKLYKINVNNIEDLSDESNYNQYTLAYYPMLNYYPYISKARYFLLGYKCNKDGEMQYIVYGIPGSKEKNDQPYGGKTGFVTWTSDNEKRIGYWLMFYDFKNSSIVIPTK